MPKLYVCLVKHPRVGCFGISKSVRGSGATIKYKLSDYMILRVIYIPPFAQQR